MNNNKETLAQLIEAFGAARYSQNQDLVRMAAQQITEFLQKVEIVGLPPVPPQVQLQQEPVAEVAE